MIELDEFELPPKEYFQLVFWDTLTYSLRFCAYMSVFLFFLAIIFAHWTVWAVTFIISLLLPVFCLIFSYSAGKDWTYSLPTDHAFPKKKITFENGMYHVVCKNGSESKGPLSNFYEADVRRGYYRLFMDKVYYMVIPATAFRSEDDRVRFEIEILGDKLKKQTIPWDTILSFLKLIAILFVLACVVRINITDRLLQKVTDTNCEQCWTCPS